MFVFYDLGAEGGIPENWKSEQIKELFSEIEIVAFDLDDKKLSINNNQHSVKLIDKIISGSDGKRDFYIPVRDSGSSLYPFNEKYSYLHEESYHPIREKIVVETASLQSLIDSKKIRPADIIKMDIQGAELSALQGLGKYIKTLSVLEIEVEFLQIYQGQPTFSEIHQFLMSSGFHLLDMHLSKSFYSNGKEPNHYLKKFTKSEFNGNWTPQVYAGDALYVKDIDQVLELDCDGQIRHLECLCAYKCFDRAFLIIDRSKYKLDIKESLFFSKLTRLAKKGSFSNIILTFGARILRKFGIFLSPVFDRKYPWIKRNFPNL